MVKQEKSKRPRLCEPRPRPSSRGRKVSDEELVGPALLNDALTAQEEKQDGT